MPDSPTGWPCCFRTPRASLTRKGILLITGVLTRIIVTNHREPYGYFSVDLPEFEEQFERKNIRDRFRVGEDVDAISRATITVRSASRAVRNSARRVARAYLTPPEQ